MGTKNENLEINQIKQFNLKVIREENWEFNSKQKSLNLEKETGDKNYIVWEIPKLKTS